METEQYVDKVVLNRKSYERLKELFDSSDVENHTVAIDVMVNCDIERSITYLILIFRKYGRIVSKDVLSNVVKSISDIGIDTSGVIYLDKIYPILKDKIDQEAKDTLLDEMASSIRDKLITIGYNSMKSLNLIIKESLNGPDV